MKKTNYVLLLMIIFACAITNAYTVELNMTFDNVDGIYNSTFAQDLSVNGYNGTVNNSIIVDGVRGQAYKFNPTTGSVIKIINQNKLRFFNHDFFISYWVKNPTNNSIDGWYLGNFNLGGTPQITFRTDSISNKPYVNILYRNVSDSQQDERVDNYISENWHHYLLKYNNSGTISVYKNGILLESFSHEGLYNGRNDQTLIGGNIVFDSANLIIDEVLFANGSISKNEIKQLYNSYGIDYINVVAYGDSITGGTVSLFAYSDYLENIGINANSFAEGGRTVVGVLNNLSLKNNEDYNNSIVLIGTNNVGNQNTYYQNLSKLTTLLEGYGQNVYLSTIPPYNGEDEEVELLNDKIRRVSYENEISYVDIFTNIFGGAYSASDFIDGVHPTKLKQSDMADYYYTKLTTTTSSFNCKAVGNGEECFGGLRYHFLDNFTNDESNILNISFDSGTRILDINCTGTNILLDNLEQLENEVTQTYDVFHNGVYVTSSSSYTYNLPTCSNWSFSPSNTTGQFNKQDCYEGIVSYSYMGKFFPLIVVSLLLLVIVGVFFFFTNNNFADIDVKQTGMIVIFLIIGVLMFIVSYLVLTNLMAVFANSSC